VKSKSTTFTSNYQAKVRTKAQTVERLIISDEHKTNSTPRKEELVIDAQPT